MLLGGINFTLHYRLLTGHARRVFANAELRYFLGLVAATRHARKKVVTVHADAVDFKRPVPLGAIVELVARLKEVGRTSMRVEVEMWVEPVKEGEEAYLAARGGFVLVAVDEGGRPSPVPPLEGGEARAPHGP